MHSLHLVKYWTTTYETRRPHLSGGFFCKKLKITPCSSLSRVNVRNNSNEGLEFQPRTKRIPKIANITAHSTYTYSRARSSNWHGAPVRGIQLGLFFTMNEANTTITDEGDKQGGNGKNSWWRFHHWEGVVEREDRLYIICTHRFISSKSSGRRLGGLL